MSELRYQSRIVILDDKLENVLLLEEILTDAGYQNLHCLTDPRKMDEALMHRPDAILLDIRMPHVNGIQVIEQVRHHYIEGYGDAASQYMPKIMVLTADNDEALKLDALQLGAQDYLTKPLNQFEVTQRLANLLSQHCFTRQQAEHNDNLKAKVQSQTERLQALSHIDPATGLFNRRYIFEQLHKDLAEGHTFALLAVAIHGLDDISRVRGQELADHLQIEIADRLRSYTEQHQGWLGSYDSHMFIVSLNTDLTQAMKDAQNMCEVINERVTNLMQGRVRARIGVYYRNTADPAAADNVLRHTIQAVPRGLSGNIGQYNEALSEAENRQYKLKLAFPHLNFDNGLSLALQPKIDLLRGECKGAEALLRWQHEELGAISPLEFIELAEETGDIRILGDKIVHQAMHLRAQWHAEALVEPDFQLAVNVAAQQLVKGFASFFMLALHKHGLQPAMMAIEVTESGLAQNVEEAYTELETLRAKGIEVAIDDFGTGYSSLQYIKSLPADWVKIDRSFIVDLLQTERDQFLVKSVIDMATGLGYQVVAEGVECEEEARWLQQHGCHVAQGYHFARPLTNDALREFLRGSQGFRSKVTVG